MYEGLAKDLSDPFRKFRGYVAVDNIALRNGLECKGHCTFEGGFCGWTNDENDDFNWSLVRQSTIETRVGSCVSKSSSPPIHISFAGSRQPKSIHRTGHRSVEFHIRWHGRRLRLYRLILPSTSGRCSQTVQFGVRCNRCGFLHISDCFAASRFR